MFAVKELDKAPVSIHAPAWGATTALLIVFSDQNGFQSTLPHGERRNRCVEGAGAWMFQSTLPHGERRPAAAAAKHPAAGFNPRSRMGSDLYRQ